MILLFYDNEIIAKKIRKMLFVIHVKYIVIWFCSRIKNSKIFLNLKITTFVAWTHQSTDTIVSNCIAIIILNMYISYLCPDLCYYVLKNCFIIVTEEINSAKKHILHHIRSYFMNIQSLIQNYDRIRLDILSHEYKTNRCKRMKLVSYNSLSYFYD